MKYLSLLLNLVREYLKTPIAYCMECDKKIYADEDYEIDQEKKFSTPARRAQRLVHDGMNDAYCKTCFTFLSETATAEKYVTIKGW